MSREHHSRRSGGPEPFPVDDPVTDSVVSEDWGRMAENDEGLEGTLAEVPQTGEPQAGDSPPGQQDRAGDRSGDSRMP